MDYCSYQKGAYREEKKFLEDISEDGRNVRAAQDPGKYASGIPSRQSCSVKGCRVRWQGVRGSGGALLGEAEGQGKNGG
jgi:hypothetical protein